MHIILIAINVNSSGCTLFACTQYFLECNLHERLPMQDCSSLREHSRCCELQQTLSSCSYRAEHANRQLSKPCHDELRMRRSSAPGRLQGSSQKTQPVPLEMLHFSNCVLHQQPSSQQLRASEHEAKLL